MRATRRGRSGPGPAYIAALTGILGVAAVVVRRWTGPPALGPAEVAALLVTLTALTARYVAALGGGAPDDLADDLDA